MSETIAYWPRTTPCAGCGKPMIWGTELSTGKKIPLDARAPVYEIQGMNDGAMNVERHYNAYVSHFATCSKANDFSRKNAPASER